MALQILILYENDWLLFFYTPKKVMYGSIYLEYHYLFVLQIFTCSCHLHCSTQSNYFQQNSCWKFMTLSDNQSFLKSSLKHVYVLYTFHPVVYGHFINCFIKYFFPHLAFNVLYLSATNLYLSPDKFNQVMLTVVRWQFYNFMGHICGYLNCNIYFVFTFTIIYNF